MVSDGMAKFVFLSMSVPYGFFPAGKNGFSLFFTVKQIFLKVKKWARNRRPNLIARTGSKHEEA